VDAEWMRINSFDGRNVSVHRGQRGTKTAEHKRGAMVHYGQRLVREIRSRRIRENGTCDAESTVPWFTFSHLGERRCER